MTVREQAAQEMSRLANGKRSPIFFMAWMVEEHGWKDEIPYNNPANISGPINHEYPWYNGAVRLLPNNVVEFDTFEHGLENTVLLMEHFYPHVFQAATDEEAIVQLGEPDIYGEYWATNPEYSKQILEIYHEIKAKEPSTPTPHPVVHPVTRQYYRVVARDTMWEIAKRHGMSLQELEHLNPQIPNYDLIYVGQEIRIR